MTFADLFKKHKYISWFMYTRVGEDDTITHIGTHPGTNDGQLVILSGRLANDPRNTTEWLHLITYDGVAVLALTTGGYMHLLPGTTIAIPAHLFGSLSSPAWYGYIVLLAQ